jgi:hypothetical protein
MLVMLRSRPPQNPHKRNKRKRKPPWTDPDTLIDSVLDRRYTISPHLAGDCPCGCIPGTCPRDAACAVAAASARKKGGAK